MNDNVVVDIDIKELIPNFLDSRNKDIQDLTLALSQKDCSKLKFIGHGMKGTSLSYGFEHIGKIAKNIELCAQNKDFIAIEKDISELKRHICALHIEYEEV